MLLELIGTPRIVDPRKSANVKDFWNYGEPSETYPIDTGRLRGVVELAAEKAGWGKKLPKGHGLGIAVHRSFVTYVATVVEAVVDDKGNLSVPGVDGHRCGLRRQSRACPFAARRRGGDGARLARSTARSASRTAAPSKATSTPTR